MGLLAARKICSVKHTLAVDIFVKEKVPGEGRDVHLGLVEEKTVFGMRGMRDEASTNSLSLFKPLCSFFLLISSVLDKEPLGLKVLAIEE